MRRLVGFYAGFAVAQVGTYMAALALPWLVLSTSGSAAATGVLAFAQILPFVLASLLGAPLIDALGARRVAVVSSLAGMAVTATVPLLYGAGLLPYGVLLPVVAIAGAFQGLGTGALRVLLPTVIARAGAGRERALSVFHGLDRLSTLVGAPVGGVLIAWAGAANALWVTATALGLSAVLTLWSARGTTPPREREPYFTALRTGAAFMRADRLVLAMCVMLLVTNLTAQAFSGVYVPVWIHDVVGDPAALGTLSGVMAAGALIGTVLFTWLAPRLPRRWTFAIGFMVAGPPRFFALAFLDSLSAILVISFLAGLGAAVLNPILSAVQYERIPERLLSRVLGFTGSISWLGMPFGGLLGGLAMDSWGRVGALATTGSVYLLVTLAPFLFPVWRGMDRAPKVLATVH
ncbi:putative multidrug-efflux transporter [Actinorhabdospora filicis]|uniref:Multidrug efflux pump Tap n=1 Tax=Actinorhabdospora filicis TaxID=1785913 RepID=A0A9W6SLX1_9ACTN|nr:MFS transporter [Actinorhabdospora filicis]GLZ78403.1 putative multidrug-efflux transporter [Actinorhabdospora filicis]